MARGFRFGGAGGENGPNPVIISGNKLNYEYMDNGVVGFGTDCVTLTYQSGQSNRMYIYNVDLTNVASISITVKCSDSGGDFRIEKIGSTTVAQVLKTGSSIQTVSLDVRSYTGLQTLEFSNNYYGTSSIYNMAMTEYPEAKFPVIYDHGAWGVGYENPGNYVYTESGWSAVGMTMSSDHFGVPSSGSQKEALIGTQNKIDLTPYTLVKFLYSGNGSVSNTAIQLAIMSGKNRYTQIVNGIWLSQTSGTIIEGSIDISSYTGEYYLAMCGECGGSRLGQVYKWWLE